MVTENTLLGPSWTLAFGPGPQAELLEPLLNSLAGQAALGVPPRVEVWDDLDAVLGALSQRGRLVLDADRLPREDLGLVRRFLARRSGWEVVALGQEAPTGPIAQLLAHRRVQFAAWPLPVDRLAGLLEAPGEPTDRPLASQFRDTRSRRAQASPAHPGAVPSYAANPRPGSSATEESHVAPEDDGWEGDSWDGDLGSDDLGEWTDSPLSPRGEDLQEIETILSTGGGSLHPADLIPRGGSPVVTAPEAKLPPKQDNLLAEAMAIGLSREELDAFHAFVPDASELDLEEEADPREALESLEDQAEVPSDRSAPVQEACLEETGLDEAPLERSIPEPQAQPVPPSWYRSQVADLADLAQRLQLDSLALREAGGAASGASDAWLALEQDVLRLGQFARTLGYVAAPPPPGGQQIELSGFVQELLASLLGSQSGEGPRVLFRGEPGATVRGDKAQLGAALDAMAQLGAHCIQADESGEALRVQVSVTGGEVALEMDFPAGPLEGAEGPREDLLEPYALRRAFPDYGANALAAAGGIFSGHGGQLAAKGLENGRLALTAHLPQAAHQPD